MNTNGSVSFAVDAPESGTYLVNLSYQNYNAASAGSVEIDGAQVGTIAFESDPDSAGLEALSSSFQVAAGSHQLTIKGNGLQLDAVQWNAEKVVTGLEREKLPEGFALEQNYPNPFNPATKIKFSLGKSSKVDLTVFNILGQKVATLVNNQQLRAGSHFYEFNAGRLASGIYFYQLKADKVVTQKKMILLK